jgi:CheY-like chemotaxis protein
MPPRRVLVVEDDAAIRETLIEILQDEGYEAIGAGNGREALDKLSGPAAATPCVIFLDLMMPVMDGATFRQEQLRNPGLAGIPVVVISAYRDEDVRSLQAAHHLQKPLDLEDVLGAARRFCADEAGQ